jgi:hypothetical protein
MAEQVIAPNQPPHPTTAALLVRRRFLSLSAAGAAEMGWSATRGLLSL